VGRRQSKLGFVGLIFLLVGLGVLSVPVLLSLNRASNQVSDVKDALKTVEEFKNSQEGNYISEPLKPVNLTASFEIYTNGAKRIFTAPMYHNLSQDVYITAGNPGLVYVKKGGITWNDFFKTLPMQLSKDCLVTGTKETFCTGDNGSLHFFINGQENPNSLELKIKNEDNLLVKYE
jgi:hypothetical protein